MDNNDSLRTLLINIRNNQDLYMQHQWKVTYFCFLLYAAIIGAFKLINTERWLFTFLTVAIFLIAVISILSIFIIIWELEKSIRENRKTAEEIYDALSPLRRVVGPRRPQKKLTMGKMLSAIVAIGMIISTVVLLFIPPKCNKKLSHRVDKLDQKINQCVNTLEEIKLVNKDHNPKNHRINDIKKELSHITNILKIINKFLKKVS